MCCIMAKARKHLDFDETEEYLRNKTYPSTISARDYGSKSNFRIATKRYEVKDGHLFYKKRLAIKNKERQMEITEVLEVVYRGIGDSEHSKAVASHRGKNTTYDKSTPVPSSVMKQAGVDICKLPEVDRYRHVIILIDYFSKWSEAKPTKDKSAPTVAQFLYEVMCQHECFEIEINGQGREFVNEVCKQLHELT